jgi:hypothetical protein
VINILENFKESSEVMKANVMGYNSNKLQPAEKERKKSIINSMVYGLEKYDNLNENEPLEEINL